MNDNMCEQSPLQAEGLGQIDVESRNTEIYRKHKEGYIHAQLSREYSLSPEWIRRICEDEERRQRHSARTEERKSRAVAGEPSVVTGEHREVAGAPLLVAVVEPGQSPKVFSCRSGKVVREITEVTSEIGELIWECVERATISAKAEDNGQRK